MKIFGFVILIIQPFYTYSQQKYYYDSNWNLVTNTDKYEYYRVIDNDNIKGYYKTGQLQFNGFLKYDYSCTRSCEFNKLNTWFTKDGSKQNQFYIENDTKQWDIIFNSENKIVIDNNTKQLFHSNRKFSFFQLNKIQKSTYLQNLFETASNASNQYKNIASNIKSNKYEEETLNKLNEIINELTYNESDKKAIQLLKSKTEKSIHSFANQFTDKASKSFKNFNINIYYSEALSNLYSTIIPVDFSWKGGISGQYYQINGYFIYNNNSTYNFVFSKIIGSLDGSIFISDIYSKTFPYSESFAYNNTNGTKNFQSTSQNMNTPDDITELNILGLGVMGLIVKQGISSIWNDMKESYKYSSSDVSINTSSSYTILSQSKNSKVKVERSSTSSLGIDLGKGCFNCFIEDVSITITEQKYKNLLKRITKKQESFVNESVFVSSTDYPVIVNISYKINETFGTNKYITVTVQLNSPSRIEVSPE
jgi:hypothetical protein